MSDEYINRELSWLEFNQRVLDQAVRTDLPLLERLKFLAITASNLDEFFMVRVGGLQMLRHSGSRVKDISGLTPTRQLKAIRSRVGRMIEDQSDIPASDAAGHGCSGSSRAAIPQAADGRGTARQ